MEKFNLSAFLITYCIFSNVIVFGGCASNSEEPSTETLSEDIFEVETTRHLSGGFEGIYDADTSVLSSETSFPIKMEIDKIARAQNIALNGSKFFDTSDIVNTKLIAKKLAKEGAREVSFITEDGIELRAYFLDRKKDKIVVIGPGLTNAKEKMAPLAHIYMDYDVLITNFRGNGPKNSGFNPISNLLEMDSRVSLAAREEKDVFAAMKFIRNIPGKQYKEIIAHGICYGSLIFAKAQAMKEYAGEKLFDKLILDGTWHSLNKFRDKIIGDPKLISHPQKGGAPDYLKWLFGKEWFNTRVQKLIEWLIKIDFDDVNAVDYVSKIEIPVLYFYGKNDLTIYRNEFEEIWNATKSKNKIAIITSNEHVWNHLKQKELYKLICELFIECKSKEKFLRLINQPPELIEHLFERLQGNAYELPDENLFAPLKKSKSFWKSSISRGTALTILTAAGIYASYRKGYLPKSRREWGNLFGNAFDKMAKWFKDEKPKTSA